MIKMELKRKEKIQRMNSNTKEHRMNKFSFDLRKKLKVRKEHILNQKGKRRLTWFE